MILFGKYVHKLVLWMYEKSWENRLKSVIIFEGSDFCKLYILCFIFQNYLHFCKEYVLLSQEQKVIKKWVFFSRHGKHCVLRGRKGEGRDLQH